MRVCWLRWEIEKSSSLFSPFDGWWLLFSSFGTSFISAVDVLSFEIYGHRSRLMVIIAFIDPESELGMTSNFFIKQILSLPGERKKDEKKAKTEMERFIGDVDVMRQTAAYSFERIAAGKSVYTWAYGAWSFCWMRQNTIGWFWWATQSHLSERVRVPNRTAHLTPVDSSCCCQTCKDLQRLFGQRNARRKESGAVPWKEDKTRKMDSELRFDQWMSKN